MYWLIVERPQNWQFDKQNGFKSFGIPRTKTKMASEIKKGDKLIVYISGGVSCISDLRTVESDELVKQKGIGGYDDIFPLAILTKPTITLPKENWISIKQFVTELSITKELKDWRQTFRQAIRRITDEDGELIVKKMKEVIQNNTIELK
jgi:hypothetical protein